MAHFGCRDLDERALGAIEELIAEQFDGPPVRARQTTISAYDRGLVFLTGCSQKVIRAALAAGT